MAKPGENSAAAATPEEREQVIQWLRTELANLEDGWLQGKGCRRKRDDYTIKSELRATKQKCEEENDHLKQVIEGQKHQIEKLKSDVEDGNKSVAQLQNQLATIATNLETLDYGITRH